MGGKGLVVLDEGAWVLACETSSPQGSLALGQWQSGGFHKIIESCWSKKASHNEIIVKEFSQLLLQAQIELGHIRAFAIGRGPGSFTGVRIGLNFIRSLAYLNQAPIFGASSLAVLLFEAVQVKSDRPICAIQNAFGQKYYCSLRDTKTNHLVEDQVYSINEILSLLKNPTYLVGDSADFVFSQSGPLPELERLDSSLNTPRAKTLLAALQGDDAIFSRFKTWKELKPLYLKASTAEEKLKTGELKKQNLF